MPGFWRNWDRRFLPLVILLILAVLLASSLGFTNAQWHVTRSGRLIDLKTGIFSSRPSVYKVCPGYGVCGIYRWAVFIYGSNLKPVSGVQLVKGSDVIKATKTWPVSDELLYCVFDLRRAEKGTYDVQLAITGEKATVVSSAFKIREPGRSSQDLQQEEAPGGPVDITPGPITSFTDNSLQVEPQEAEDPRDFKVCIDAVNSAGSLILDVEGPLRSNFLSASLVRRDGFSIGSVSRVTKSGCKAEFDSKIVPAGTYDLVLTKRDDSNLLLENSVALQDTAAKIPAQPPVSAIGLAYMQPASATQGETVVLAVIGDNLEGCNAVALTCGATSILTAKPPIKSKTVMTCVFDLAGAAPGTYDLSVRGADGSQATLSGCFVIGAGTAVLPPTQTPIPQPAPQTTPPPVEGPTRNIW